MCIFLKNTFTYFDSIICEMLYLVSLSSSRSFKPMALTLYAKEIEKFSAMLSICFDLITHGNKLTGPYIG